ncbi:Rib/alpha-like domain-containing protein [Gemella cuniculi]|uniref:Rib/alpha-like domain-containing protein n=1 Tax=Gemella cuniculi TaxID=150240 RepID=UPI000428F116|nr:Rib/alpha-like domain-containing protein [Gemella cuniculi]
MFNKKKIVKYSIKKFSVGIISVAVGTFLFFNPGIQANQNYSRLNLENTIKQDSNVKKSEGNNSDLEKNKNDKTNLNVLDKKSNDIKSIKDLLNDIIKKNEDVKSTVDEKKDITESSEEKGTKIISRLTPKYAELISKGYIGLEGGKYDSLLYKKKPLDPNGDDDGDGILNKDEIYIYKKDGRTYLGYDVHPKLADTDGDGRNDKEDNDKLIWNISARDMALFMNLVYEKDNVINDILNPEKSIITFQKKSHRVMHNELSPYWKVKKVFHQNNGLDAVLFETKSNYPFLKNGTIQVLAIQGTNPHQTGDLKADAALVLGNESNQSIATKDLINSFKNDSSITNLYLTGHSLGGYLSLRATAEAVQKNNQAYKGTYTFNAPKIYSGILNFWGRGEFGRASDLTDKLAQIGTVVNYTTNNDNVIPSFLRLKYSKNIGNSAGKHSSTSYFESIINKNPDFNFGKRQGLDKEGYVDPNLGNLKIVPPENGSLSATFPPSLVDKKPISMTVGDKVKDRDILDKVDKTKLPVNVKLSVLKKDELTTPGTKKAVVKVLYQDDNSESEIDIPILVNEADKSELISVMNEVGKLLDINGDISDKTKESSKKYLESRRILAEKLLDAQKIIDDKSSSQADVNKIKKELAKAGLDFIEKTGDLQLNDSEKYKVSLTDDNPISVKKGSKIEYSEIINKINKSNLPEGTKYEITEDIDLEKIGKASVKVKIIYPDKTESEIEVPILVYEEGENLPAQTQSIKYSLRNLALLSNNNNLSQLPKLKNTLM